MSAQITLDTPVNSLRGIGEKKSEALARLGIFKLEDMLFFFPRRYEDRRNITPVCSLAAGMTACFEAEVISLSSPVSPYNIGHENTPSPTTALLSDGTGEIKAVWFNPYIYKVLKPDTRAAFYGKVEYNNYNYGLQLTNPEFEVIYNNKKSSIIGVILPVYAATGALKPKQVKNLIFNVLDNYLENSPCGVEHDKSPSGVEDFKLIREFLPEYIIKKYKMRCLQEALSELHRPHNEDLWLRARNRLAFDDLFLLQTGLFMRRAQFKNYGVNGKHSQALKAGENYKKFMASLKFRPTNAQRRAISEILNDINKSYPMNRLLQGDVGSGKTLVATAALLAACDSECQAVFMAPTEILAQQHYLKLKNEFERLNSPSGVEDDKSPSGVEDFNNITMGLLTGSLKVSERREILKSLEDGDIKILIGTHAVFSEDVKFKNLGLVIIDEQHRFGVLQRNALISKSEKSLPHVMVMTATPIPRTLTLSVFGDLDVSVLDEMPPDRKPVKTVTLSDLPDDKLKLNNIIKECIKNNNQIYWVCPLIDERESGDLSSVILRGNLLSQNFPDINIAVMHGRLSIDEKSEIMRKFVSGEIKILVSTVVIEVGVDVPNAALIIIEDAGQFGLAQLHQLRGRVGRGESESMCVLLTNQNTTPEGLERVNAMLEISDGFKLAEADLKQRGPGEICGVRQHGVTEFRAANLVRDHKILDIARKEAKELIERDPELNTEPRLKAELMRRLGDTLKLAGTA